MLDCLLKIAVYAMTFSRENEVYAVAVRVTRFRNVLDEVDTPVERDEKLSPQPYLQDEQKPSIKNIV